MTPCPPCPDRAPPCPKARRSGAVRAPCPSAPVLIGTGTGTPDPRAPCSKGGDGA